MPPQGNKRIAEQIRGEKVVVANTIHGDVIFSGPGNTQPSIRSAEPSSEDGRQLRVFLDRVRQFWIDGVLKNSIRHEALIALGMEARTDAVEYHMHQRLKRILFALLTPFLLGYVWFCIPASTHYHIEETYSFQTTDQDAKIRLAIMLPKSGPYQNVADLRVSWEGNETRESHGSVDVVKLTGYIEATHKKVATVAYDILMRQGRMHWEAPVDDSQLQPQEGIESDHPIIVEAASQIAENPDRDNAYRIYKFAATHISSWHGEVSINGSNPDVCFQSALKAFQTRNGVCGHFANLMTALCRAADIPAQSMTGWSIPSYPPLWSTTSGPWQHPVGTHGWVEFGTSEGWKMADPSAAFKMPVKSVWFGRNDGGHLCYGERSFIAAVSKKMKSWAKTDGKMVGGMTGPYRFMAGADANGVSVRPEAMLKVVWDGRWFNSFILIVLMLVVWYCPWWWRQLKQSNSKKAQPVTRADA